MSRGAIDRIEQIIESIELNSTKNPNFCVLVFRPFFGLQASYRAETLTQDRSRASRRGQKIEKPTNYRINRIDRLDRLDRLIVRSIESNRLSNPSNRNRQKIPNCFGLNFENSRKFVKIRAIDRIDGRPMCLPSACI